MDPEADRPSPAHVGGKHPGGRPPGSRNRVTRRLQIIMDKLESEGAIKPRVWLTRLEEIANSDAPDRVPALRLLLAYRFGGPPMHLQIEHGLTESAETILRRIAQSDAHRERLEALERRRLRAASITAEVVEETVAAAPDVDDATAPAAVG